MKLAKKMNQLEMADVDILYPVFHGQYERYGIIEDTFEELKVYKLSKDTTLGFENSVRHPLVAQLFDMFLSKSRHDVYSLSQFRSTICRPDRNCQKA